MTSAEGFSVFSDSYELSTDMMHCIPAAPDVVWEGAVQLKICWHELPHGNIHGTGVIYSIRGTPE